MQRKLLFAVLCFCLVIPARAQSLKNGEWRTYTSMRTVRALAVSKDGQSVWAATSGGAFRALLTQNGVELDNSGALRTTDGLTENDLTAVATDADGNTYVGGRTGSFDVIHADGTVGKLGSDIRSKSDLPVKTINAILAQGDSIFLSTAYGLEIYRKKQGYYAATVFQLGAQVPRNDSVRQVAIFQGNIFAAMHEGLAYARLTKDISIAANWSLIKDSTIGSVFALSVYNNTLCVGTTKGLFTYSTTSNSLVPTPYHGGVDRLAAGTDSLYILDQSGAMKATADLTGFVNVDAPNAGSNVTSIAVAKNIGILFGTQQNGIAFWLGTQPHGNIYPSGPVSNLTLDLDFGVSKGLLFYASATSGFGWFDPSNGAWKNYDNGTVFPRGSVFGRELYDSVRDLLWLSTGGGLFVMHHPGIDPVESETIDRIPSGLPSSVPDPNDPFLAAGRPYVTTAGDLTLPTWAHDGTGLSILDHGSHYHFTNYKIFDAPATWGCLTQDLEGNFWAGGEAGQTYPPNSGMSWHRMDSHTYGNIAAGPNGLINNSVNAIITDQDDEIWCGTSGGLQILSNPYAIKDANPKFYFRTVKFIGQAPVRSIVVDGVGNKWIGTENGIFVVSPDGSDSVARFTTANSPLIDNFITALAIDPLRGEAYAATPSGISRFSTIFKEGKSDYSAMRAYPNPITQTTEQSPVIYIDGLMAGSTVKIFTLNMKLVKSINGENLGSTVVWNGRDDAGHQVPSGEYLISATTQSSGEHGAAKVVIIRE